jgi:hypothetical protein
MKPGKPTFLAAKPWTDMLMLNYPDNVIVNQLFGVSTGLGMGILTFDWSQILYAGNPLNIPWWAQVNVGISFVVLYWVIVPALYYTNVSILTQPLLDLLDY